MGLNDYPFSAELLTPPQTFAFLITNFICGSPLQLYITEESHISKFGTTHKLEIFYYLLLSSYDFLGDFSTKWRLSKPIIERIIPGRPAPVPISIITFSL